MKKTKIAYTVVIRTTRGSWEESKNSDQDLEAFVKSAKNYALTIVYPHGEFLDYQLYRQETHYFPIRLKE